MRLLVVLALLGACAQPKRSPSLAVASAYQGDLPRGAPPPAEPAVSETSVEQRRVHYAGWARLRVTRVREALDAIAAEAVARGGRVEHLAATSIVVRVPAADFDAAWADIRSLGDVLDESVVAEDVTESFFAVDLRIRTLTVTRDRLVVLLARTEDEQEKLALLHELQRVTELLDAFERQRRMVTGLSDFSRISIDVVPREAVGGDAGGAVVAGFGWIASLSPFHRGVGSEEKRLALPVPDGMVAIDPKGQFIAESPEGAALWTGRVANDPRADAAFWIAAVTDRVAGDFASATGSTRGRWTCVTLADGAEDTPYTWEICAAADPDDRRLSLAQAYYPDPDAVRRYQAAVTASLTGGAS